ncbi:MAG: hypothetical protein LBU65_09585 [Planctomycetaceae bacterium]|nr:hypothetical protein [Planctomycetaceae bacterium]
MQHPPPLAVLPREQRHAVWAVRLHAAAAVAGVPLPPHISTAAIIRLMPNTIQRRDYNYGTTGFHSNATCPFLLA